MVALQLLLMALWVRLTSCLELVILCQQSCCCKMNKSMHTVGEGSAGVAAVRPAYGMNSGLRLGE